MTDPVHGVRLASSTNSTMFTDCCHCAICDDQERCPVCKDKIIGWDEESKHARGLRRLHYAYHP